MRGGCFTGPDWDNWPSEWSRRRAMHVWVHATDLEWFWA